MELTSTRGHSATRFQSMKHLTDLDTAGNQLFASSFNMGNDQVETLGRARRGRRYLRAELDRAPRAGRRELDDPESVVEWEICIEPPPKLCKTLSSDQHPRLE